MDSTELVSLLGILGTLSGTLGGVGLSYLIEKSRWQREDKTRFHLERYPKYVEFLQKAEGLLLTTIESSDEYNLADAMWEAEAHIQMLATEPVRKTARAYAASIMEEKFGSGVEGDTEQKFDKLDTDSGFQCS